MKNSIIDILHYEGIKVSEKRKSQFPVTADNQPVFPEIPVIKSKNFRKHVKLNSVSQILRFSGVWVILPPPLQPE